MCRVGFKPLPYVLGRVNLKSPILMHFRFVCSHYTFMQPPPTPFRIEKRKGQIYSTARFPCPLQRPIGQWPLEPSKRGFVPFCDLVFSAVSRSIHFLCGHKAPPVIDDYYREFKNRERPPIVKRMVRCLPIY